MIENIMTFNRVSVRYIDRTLVFEACFVRPEKVRHAKVAVELEFLTVFDHRTWPFQRRER